MKGFLRKTSEILFAKKVFSDETIEHTKLARVLTLWDLSFLGLKKTKHLFNILILKQLFTQTPRCLSKASHQLSEAAFMLRRVR